jgi:FAD-dependent oxidoreductase domain-containing protein 1
MFSRRFVQSSVRERRFLSTGAVDGCSSFSKSLPDSLECDYLVVGGGPVGSSIAYHLAKAIGNKQHRIVVVEKDFCYRHTSAMLSAGGIRQQFSLPENIMICMYGAEFIKDPSHFKIPSSSGEDEIIDIQFHENGYLFLADEKNRQVLLNNLKTQHSCGATWIEKLEKEALLQEFPWLNIENIDIGTYGRKNEGYFDPWSFVNGLKKKSISLGVEYIEGCAYKGNLVSVSPNSPASSYNIESVDITTTATPQRKSTNHRIHARHVINAAGAWSGRFLENCLDSVPLSKGIKRIPIAPRPRSIFGVNCRQGAVHPLPSPQTPLVIDPSGVYFRPEGKQLGKYIVGTSPIESEDREVLQHEEVTALGFVDSNVFEEKIWPVLATLVPAFEQLKVTSSWTGFYDYNRLDQVVQFV